MIELNFLVLLASGYIVFPICQRKSPFSTILPTDMKKRATCFWCDSMNQRCVTSCVSVSIGSAETWSDPERLLSRRLSFPSKNSMAQAPRPGSRGYNHSVLTTSRFSIVSGCVNGTTSLYSAGRREFLLYQCPPSFSDTGYCWTGWPRQVAVQVSVFYILPTTKIVVMNDHQFFINWVCK